MTEHGDASPDTRNAIWVSRPVKVRFDQIQEEMADDLGRRVTQSEVMERLIANQWGCKP